MPGKIDEKIWEKAKTAAKKSYPDISHDGDKFWAIVQGIYDKMNGTRMKNWQHEPHASDNPTIDVHATDPMRLAKECKKDLGVKDSPETINNPRPNPDSISGIQSATDKYMRNK